MIVLMRMEPIALCLTEKFGVCVARKIARKQSLKLSKEDLTCGQKSKSGTFPQSEFCKIWFVLLSFFLGDSPLLFSQEKVEESAKGMTKLTAETDWKLPKILGFQPPLVEARAELEEHVGKLITIRGKVGRGPHPRVLGNVYVKSPKSHWRKEVYTVGILIKRKARPYLDGNGEPIPILKEPTYSLYSSTNGQLATTKTILDSIEKQEEQNTVEENVGPE